MEQKIIDDVKERLRNFITSDIGGVTPMFMDLQGNSASAVISVCFTLTQMGYEGVKRTVPGGLGTHSDAA